MLTALSVAHDCKMVNPSDRIVLVEAKMVMKDGAFVPQCQFVAEDNPADVKQSISLFDTVLFSVI